MQQAVPDQRLHRGRAGNVNSIDVAWAAAGKVDDGPARGRVFPQQRHQPLPAAASIRCLAEDALAVAASANGLSVLGEGAPARRIVGERINLVRGSGMPAEFPNGQRQAPTPSGGLDGAGARVREAEGLAKQFVGRQASGRRTQVALQQALERPTLDGVKIVKSRTAANGVHRLDVGDLIWFSSVSMRAFSSLFTLTSLSV